MIGFLKGTVELRDEPYLFINVNGVGYKVLVCQDILSSVQAGQTIMVYTYTHVREDALELFGFASFEDLKLFESLISVSGVGPKTAINIFSFGTGSQILDAIAASNVSFFTSVPRLGTKNAQKIIIELKNKLTKQQDSDIASLQIDGNEEAAQALKTIGFTGKEIQDALRNIKNANASTEEKIKLALKYLGK